MNFLSNPGDPIDMIRPVPIPPIQIPSMRTRFAVQLGVEKNILIHTWGGIGDQICAEPTLRYAIKEFKGCTVSLASERPELFRHLDFHTVYDTRKVRPIMERYFPFWTIIPAGGGNLQWEFMSHMLVNCVDYPALCAFRCQLPVADREVKLTPTDDDRRAMFSHWHWSGNRRFVAVHPGKHWPSKTFPVDWWNSVIREILELGAKPVLIGANIDDNRGTVDVDTAGCADLRGKLSIMETVALLQESNVLLTNDSAPLHMAVSGDTHVGFVASCKHPDMITHWRKGQWGWRMKNFGLGGIWDIVDNCPNKPTVDADEVDADILRSWLPDPKVPARWAVERFDEP